MLWWCFVHHFSSNLFRHGHCWYQTSVESVLVNPLDLDLVRDGVYQLLHFIPFFLAPALKSFYEVIFLRPWQGHTSLVELQQCHGSVVFGDGCNFEVAKGLFRPFLVQLFQTLKPCPDSPWSVRLQSQHELLEKASSL